MFINQIRAGFVCLLLVAQTSHALDATWEYAVQVSATVETSPPRIILSWPQDTLALPSSYTIYRKAPGATAWGAGMPLPGSTTTFVDTNVLAGSQYEYQVHKSASGYNGYGYICAGMEVPLIEHRGQLILVVDNTYAGDLVSELALLQQDLTGDGWTVVRRDVSRNDPVSQVKSVIKAAYDAAPAEVKAVLLFGRVPVPYSGNIVPDGHAPDHTGAWPADAFYGDMDGTWTDHAVSTSSATEGRNRNVPGDGKFDQSEIPSAVELQVGRVDLANMPGRKIWAGPPTFPGERELLRQYLGKNHRFRHKMIDVPRRGLVHDSFGTRGGEAFAASGYRNFAPFFGASGLTTLAKAGEWIPTLSANSYLWAYGCGAGSYVSIGGLGNTGVYQDGTTLEVVESDIKAVFTIVMGSWLGDWDSEDNFMRAVLATPTLGLACGWSGRPHWFLHHMALGENIGYGARLTQNNGKSGLYKTQINSSAGQIHIALMGDPTLRMHPVAPPSGLTSAPHAGGTDLNWSPSPEPVAGYHVYRADRPDGPFTRLTSSLLGEPNFRDAVAGAGPHTYMVRAVKLETSASGTYLNPSQGIFITLGGLSPTGLSVKLPAHFAAAFVRLASARVLEILAGPKLMAAALPDGTEGRAAASDVEAHASVVWVEDELPAGALPDAEGGDSWNWVTSHPAPFSGGRAHQSNVTNGLHQHFFNFATATLPVNKGDTLFAHIYLDPANVPSQAMLQWTDGSWNHRAYWGANRISAGTNGTVSRRYMGPLPAAGQWARLEVPASEVNLEGKVVKGMAFSLFDGRATWDAAGKSSASIVSPPVTNVPPIGGVSGVRVDVTDYTNLELPKAGNNALRILSPTLLELQLINSKEPDPAQVTQWNLVDANHQFRAPSVQEFSVRIDNQPVTVQAVGFKRRPLYAPLYQRDLRIDNYLYLRLANPITDHQGVDVRNPSGALWPATMQFTNSADPLRFSPAIHVNQEGYVPSFPKKAMVGHYLGSFGELSVSVSSGFKLVEADTGKEVFQGSLTARPDVGWSYAPTPYQKVWLADFTSFTRPGEYRVVVPGLGASLPFLINDGIAMDFARTYALGLYHQRCGTDNALPFTRHTHEACHTAMAEIPVPRSSFAATWGFLAEDSANYANNPRHTARQLRDEASQLYPFVNRGKIDVSRGHHDAGDYSKYTINSAGLVHYLMFAVDAFAGVADLDNLGLPESGDGISDVMQEAKWEADFLAKMQDADGGFYFLVYPRDRRYESNILPSPGDAQVVWPKNTAATAASVAALAQTASSPKFKQRFPAEAALYLQKAKLGWKFLTDAIARHGKNGSYQKLNHYGDEFMHDDELAWAACEMFLATGDPAYQQKLMEWFDPASPGTWRWGWWRLWESYGRAVRSYAFAAKTGRLAASQLNAAFLAKCNTQVLEGARDHTRRARDSAYGTSFPSETKRVRGAGWYFSSERAFDITVAYQLTPSADFLEAILSNLNYEGGCNPVNVSYVTGLGWKRQREIVHQFALNDRRVLPPSGIPLGNVQFGFLHNATYKSEPGALCFPWDDASSAPYPYYDRWGDSFNVSTEFVHLDQARSLASLAFLAALTPVKAQPWSSARAQIAIRGTGPFTASLVVPGLDLDEARVVWEAQGQEPSYGTNFTFMPGNNGLQWVEAEAQWPDGRRVFAATNVVAEIPVVVWVNDSLPTGAVSGADGGDSWKWVAGSPAPFSGTRAHQSNLATGAHQHFFNGATETLAVKAGDILFVYVYLDPANKPSEVMVQWNDGTWEHRAYWGDNRLAFGSNGTNSRRNMGPLPAAGEWVRLEIPAAAVGLEGRTIKGMGFSLFGGRATWDSAGKLSP